MSIVVITACHFLEKGIHALFNGPELSSVTSGRCIVFIDVRTEMLPDEVMYQLSRLHDARNVHAIIFITDRKRYDNHPDDKIFSVDIKSTKAVFVSTVAMATRKNHPLEKTRAYVCNRLREHILTQQQRKIVTMIKSGDSLLSIAEGLGIQPKTVYQHISRLKLRYAQRSKERFYYFVQSETVYVDDRKLSDRMDF